MLLDKKGIASPFEDIPALMVVSIGVAILLASLANAFLSFEEEAQKDDSRDMLNDLICALRTYDKLQEEGKGQGIFSSVKLSSLNASLIAMDLNIVHEFSISFKDTSSYGSDLEYHTQSEDIPDVGTEEVLWRSTPVGITYGDVVHAGTMTVTIWGF